MLGDSLRKLIGQITGKSYLDEASIEAFIKELQRALLMADVNVRVVFDLCARVRGRLKKDELKGYTKKEMFVKIIYDELTQIFGEKYEPTLEPRKILVLGLYGSGKTTTCAKMAHFYKSKGLGAALICLDFDRPAAREQLSQLAEKIHCKFYSYDSPGDFLAASLPKSEVLIFDTAGRNALDSALIDELKSIDAKVQADERLLVVSADIGQAVKKQTEEFDKAVDVTGVIVTKLDGSAKGGGALTSAKTANVPITFVGTGEKIEELELFDAKKYTSRLLGFPDFEGLMEKVKQLELKEADLLEEKLNFRTFQQQMREARKLGPLKNVLGMMGAHDVPDSILSKGEDKMKQFDVIINSMTKEERENPELLKQDRNRMLRIARGAGTSEEVVRELVGEFNKMEKMLSKIMKNKNLRKQFENMMKGGNLGFK
mgnify:CR=1 FL=1